MRSSSCLRNARESLKARFQNDKRRNSRSAAQSSMRSWWIWINEQTPHDLPRRPFGQIRAQFDRVGNLVCGKARTAVLQQFFFGGLRTLLEHHECLNDLAFA